MRSPPGVRPFRLEKATETRNACPYCAVACGVLVYSVADAKDGKAKVIHIEGDPDHPVNRGTLCPRGAASLGYRAQRQPAEVSDAPQAGHRQVRARELGLRDGPHRPA